MVLARRWSIRSLVLFPGLFAAWLVVVCAGPAPAAATTFETWLGDLRTEAVARGISPVTFDRAMAGVQPIESVIERDQRQPEFTQTFWRYLDRRATPKRIERGRKLLAEHRRLLETVRRAYGVQPRFLVALWGLETNYGDNVGAESLFSALATLAFDPRRDRFFREQLLVALAGVERGDIPFDAVSSWAGAMGQLQFLPTTYKRYAVDFDGDGRRDLWGSLPDAFASAANYLASEGWEGGRLWGREVRLPAGFDYALTGLDSPRPLGDWRQLGVRRADGGALPRVNIDGAIVLPGGAAAGPPLLTYRNFRIIMIWNRSILYAVSVGHLSDRLVGGGPFVTKRPIRDIALSRDEVMEIQSLLASLGFEIGDIDGVIGSRTRKAIRGFQQQAMLPADGYPSAGLLQRLRSEAYR